VTTTPKRRSPLTLRLVNRSLSRSQLTCLAIPGKRYPNVAWFCLRRDVCDRIAEYKARYSIATREQAIERMLGLTVKVKS